VSGWWLRRTRRRAAASVVQGVSPVVSLSAPQEAVREPSGEGVRLERLKTLAALRDSGALTEQEFEAEKRRILEGY
jgi:hypothetical protein